LVAVCLGDVDVDVKEGDEEKDEGRFRKQIELVNKRKSENGVGWFSQEHALT
jgi:hypothetical protein